MSCLQNSKLIQSLHREMRVEVRVDGSSFSVDNGLG